MCAGIADVDVVGSVDHRHTKQVIDALNAGKDGVCEKPVTLTIREGQQIEEALENDPLPEHAFDDLYVDSDPATLGGVGEGGYPMKNNTQIDVECLPCDQRTSAAEEIRDHGLDVNLILKFRRPANPMGFAGHIFCGWLV
ncbi:Gfo/Idh/MocA family oxidoreductase [Crateriforma spongiae]|uniref:Gfo/Idh/MocA family oxidoreductase n=1 Tax=Crateriforma spongiae TaxID=2724528 RepID=UPI0039AEC69D